MLLNAESIADPIPKIAPAKANEYEIPNAIPNGPPCAKLLANPSIAEAAVTA